MDSIAPIPESIHRPLSTLASPPPSSSDASSALVHSPDQPPSRQSTDLCSLSTPPSPHDHQILPCRIPLPASRLPSLVAVQEGGEPRPRPAEDPPAAPAASFSSHRPRLDIEDRQQMQELMSLRCSKEHYVMASEVIGIIVPALCSSSNASIEDRLIASNDQASRLAKSLARWCDLSQHPLCTLISTIVFLERLFALHPQFNESAISADTFLRLSFASFLLALKTTCDRSFHNSAFVRYTPWSLSDINVMERELLGASKYDLYIPSTEFLHRATGFWTQHLQEVESARLASTTTTSSSTYHQLLLLDSTTPVPPTPPSSPTIGNLFLTQRRVGKEEPEWKGGILHSPGRRGDRLRSKNGAEETVWKDGRLQRTEAWVRSKTDAGPAARKKSKPKPRVRRATDGGFFTAS